MITPNKGTVKLYKSSMENIYGNGSEKLRRIRAYSVPIFRGGRGGFN